MVPKDLPQQMLRDLAEIVEVCPSPSPPFPAPNASATSPGLTPQNAPPSLVTQVYTRNWYIHQHSTSFS